jgi:hypothetical protein
MQRINSWSLATCLCGAPAQFIRNLCFAAAWGAVETRSPKIIWQARTASQCSRFVAEPCVAVSLIRLSS